MNHRPLIVAGLGVAILATALSRPAKAEIDIAEVTTADIAKAWKARAARIRSARISFDEVQWLAKGQSPGPTTPDKPFPPEDTTLRLRYTLSFDSANRLRLETDGPGRWGDEFIDEHRIAVFNGRDRKAFWRLPEFPHGEINDSSEEHELRSMRLFPFKTWRGTVPAPGWFNMDFNRYATTGETKKINGFNCLGLGMIENATTAGHLVNTVFWVSPDQEYNVVSYVATERGKLRPHLMVETRFERDSTAEWCPTAVRLVRGAGERPDEIVELTVMSCEINPETDPSEFELEFPEGALVHDFRDDQMFIMRPDGQRRRITSSERRQNLTYQQLAATEAPAEYRRAPSSARTWLIAAAVGLILLVAWRFVRPFR